MNKKLCMKKFIEIIQNRNLLTKFIMNVFDYNDLHDYNYIFRMIMDKDLIILDIYDNISNNRFNRYIFDFKSELDDIDIIQEGNVFVTKLPIKNMLDDDNKLCKLAYLFKLDNSKMIEYSKTFLDNEFVLILEEIIK